MKVSLNKIIDESIDNHDIKINSKYDESKYIFNYLWNNMLPHGKDMSSMKANVELFVMSDSLSIMYDGVRHRINIRTRFLKGFLTFYKSNITAMQIAKLDSDIYERRKLAMIMMNGFLYNGHSLNQKTLLKIIKEVF